MVSGVSTVTYLGGVELMTPISPPAPGKLSTDTNTKSVAMPANYLKGIPGLADDAKQVMWNQLTYDQQTSSASVWNNLPSTGSGSGGVADLSSAEQRNTKGGFTGNYDQYGLVANRSSMSIAPNDPTAKGVNTLVGENLKNLLFVDLQADPTEAADSNLSARLSSALSIMQGRLGGSQGLLAVDLN